MAAQFLDEFARELGKIGERAFRQRYGVPVTDCASTNGTAVNGAAVQGPAAVRLCGGEIVTLGRLELTFETPAGFAVLVGGLDGA